jgi:diguanylate cyclase (GGDEF)-like protein
MMAQGEPLGVLYLQPLDGGSAPIDEKRAIIVAERIALALANLKLRAALQNLSFRDPLTGLFNRRYMEESLERELRRAVRNQHPVGVILCDLDHFKQFNDTFGHEAGDALLRQTGTVLPRLLRASDIACRYGGEEFMLILPEACLETVLKRADRVRTAIRQLKVQHGTQLLGPVTLSIGIALFPDHGQTGEAVLRAADIALYQAKTEGRDRVVVAEPVETDQPL